MILSLLLISVTVWCQTVASGGELLFQLVVIRRLALNRSFATSLLYSTGTSALIPMFRRQRAGCAGSAVFDILDKWVRTIVQNSSKSGHCHIVCIKVALGVPHLRHVGDTLGHILFSFSLVRYALWTIYNWSILSL
ncbi:hypothetical protein XELAEV_18026958mg [Xenopus laevis]|uniref:Secreted protein n=1 Tax=Xenopus laevis TaxID=8355 RepID=A0A974HJ82_XENLA|nr:hypothetical protein XELAEV_18026958mg [Xenopus laevis]